MGTINQIRHFLICDPRHFQIIYLTTFMFLGHFLLDWYPSPFHYVAAFFGCLLSQSIGNVLTGRKWHDLKSALITALGLSLLCHSNSPITMVLAGSLAIASKFLLRFNQKHIYNPANFGIILVVLMTGDAWISPGQWGQEGLLVLLFSAAGLMILFNVGRLDVGLTFLFSFAALLFLKEVLYKSWSVDHWLHSLSSGSLLLFSFFMITDPISTPNAPKARYFWAIWVAILTFILGSWWKVHDAPLWALFFSAPLTAFLDRYLKHQKFSWFTDTDSNRLLTNT
ncbi:MAG: RnfABCDGE type electron transport complex subunit D [Bacteroidia bacterium]|nr:RnfABCDGE type electron transport complex subunit D [Bacteroidia bacterium]